MKRPLSKITLLLALLVAGQSVTAGTKKKKDPRLKNISYSGVTAVNVSADPQTVEVHLRAVVGTWNFGRTLQDTSDCYMYVDENQDAGPTIPGPLIVANKGDTVIVRLTNDLPVDTTIHWHGIQLYANQDGTPVSQEPIKPGECFTYKFKVNDAKFTWYHSHVATRIQIARGLHGGLLIRDQKRDNHILKSNDHKPLKERILIMGDVLLDKNDQLAPFTLEKPEYIAQNIFNGRGNEPLIPGTFDYLTINGKINPRICMSQHTAERWRMVNIANSLFMRFAFDNENAKMWRVGGDAGFIENPLTVTIPQKAPLPQFGIENPVYGLHIGGSDPSETEGILLTPGERADVVAVAPETHTFKLKWFDTWRGRHVVSPALELLDDPNDGLYGPLDLITITTRKTRGTGDKYYQPPKYISTVDRYDVTDQEPKTMLFNFGHGPIPPSGNVVMFATTKSKDPTLPPPVAGPLPIQALTPRYAQGNPDNNVAVNPGDILFIRVQNFTRGWHNYHQHGFDFQLIQYEFYQPDGNGGVTKTVVPATLLEDKDTTLVPGRPTEAPGSKTVAVFRTFISDVGRESRVVAYPELGLNDDTTPIFQQPVHRNPAEPISAIGCSQFDYRSGGWLAHCHILEHSNAGMMGVIMVSEEE